MHQGTIDLIIFGLIVIGLQAWWIFPIVRRNNASHKKSCPTVDHQALLGLLWYLYLPLENSRSK